MFLKKVIHHGEQACLVLVHSVLPKQFILSELCGLKTVILMKKLIFIAWVKKQTIISLVTSRRS